MKEGGKWRKIKSIDSYINFVWWALGSGCKLLLYSHREQSN